MLISIKDIKFTFIGKYIFIITRIQQHNSRLGSVSTEPIHLRPYDFLAYIGGFDSKTDIFNVENLWKEIRDRQIINGVNDAKAWYIY